MPEALCSFSYNGCSSLTNMGTNLLTFGVGSFVPLLDVGFLVGLDGDLCLGENWNRRKSKGSIDSVITRTVRA